jgi:hypothetical protein
MEGGTTLVDWISYGIIGFVLFALAVLALRSAWFFLSLLAIPVTDVLARRTRLGGALRRWGERGEAVGPTRPGAPAEVPAPSLVPRTVRHSAGVGAALGALPGVWWAARGAVLTLRGGGTALEALAQAALGLGLVAAAGVLVGAAAGALTGVAIDAVRTRR